MATFVLVHGAWHGGWCWQLVAPIMRATKHEVHTPTLTGLGDRAHLLACGVDLSTHVRDITSLLFYEDLRNIILIGHGAGSLVLNGVAVEMADRIGQMVHFDTYLPVNSQFPFDAWTTDAPGNTRSAAAAQSQAVRQPPAASTLGITDPVMAKWVQQRLSPQPLSTYQLATPEAHARATAALAGIPHTYIHCALGPMSTLTQPYAERARADGWNVYELDAAHDAMLTHPQDVAELLLDLDTQ